MHVSFLGLKMSAILPNAVTHFDDNNGTPLAGGQVFFYIPNTSTPKNTFQDKEQTILNTNPVILDSRGEAIIWGSGTYRQVLKDSAGNLIWDRITQDPNAGLTGNMVDNVFVAGIDFTPGMTTQLTLSANPGSLSNLWVFFDSLFQADPTLSLIGTNTLGFDAPIPVGVSVVTIKIGSTTSIGTPGQGTVTDDSVAANAAISATKLSFLQAGAGAVRRTVQSKLRDIVHIDDFGGKADGTTLNDQAFLNAIASMRTNPRVIDQGDAAHTMVTCYTSGKIILGRGVYRVSAEILNITQDQGLTFEGQGSRGASGSNYGATVLMVNGSTGAYGLRIFGNGARNFEMRHLDFCYDNSGYVGGLMDLLTTVGFVFEDVYFGSYNFSSAGTLLSAAWLARLNEFEFGRFSKCVFNGAAIGAYFDDIHGGSGWLGAGLSFDDCTFYDFSDTHMRNDGAKVARSVSLRNTGFNPINVGPTRCMNLSNMDGFEMQTCLFESSSGSAPSVEWGRVLNSQGSIRDTTFGAFIKAGTFSGHLFLHTNNVASPEGWTFLQGSISTESNRFDNCAHAITLASQVDTLSVHLSNDRFGAGVGYSYYCNDTSTLISGRINYAKARDFSVNTFFNVNMQLEFVGAGEVQVSGPLQLTYADTGRTFFLNSGAIVALPNPIIPGISYNFIKTGSGNARVDSAASGTFYTGDVGAFTSLVGNNTNLGINFSVKSFGSVAWTCSSRSAGWVAS